MHKIERKGQERESWIKERTKAEGVSAPIKKGKRWMETSHIMRRFDDM